MRPVKAREVDGILILSLDDPASVNDGQSDLYRRSVYDQLEELERPRVAVDLAPIDFLSSSGVALLIGLRRRVIAAQGAIVLFGLHPHVKDLLRVMKIAPLFPVAEEEAAALALLPSLPAL